MCEYYERNRFPTNPLPPLAQSMYDVQTMPTVPYAQVNRERKRSWGGEHHWVVTGGDGGTILDSLAWV